MKKFKTPSGEYVDLLTHTLSIINTHNDVKIYVGTDSLNSKQFSTYCTVVAYRYGKRGTHFIYLKDSIKRIRDRYARLWKEVEKSVEIAQFLESSNIPIETIELDLNSDKRWMSNSVVGSGVGYCTGLGFRCNIKPDEQVATRAADHILTH